MRRCTMPASGVRKSAGRKYPMGLQRGYATLTIGVVLLIVLSLMSIYLTRSGIIDIRTAANKVRQAEALADAEKNLEESLAWMKLASNRSGLPQLNWKYCGVLGNKASGQPYKANDLGNKWKCLPVSVSASLEFVLATQALVQNPSPVPAAAALADGEGRTYTLVAEGISVDQTASAVVRQGVYFYSPGNDGSVPAMMGAGNIPINGNFTVVPNPNGGGKGVPVSVWSRAVIDPLSGSAQTCQLGEYEAGVCSANSISNSTVGKGKDIVDGDTTNFPEDVFEFITGRDSANWADEKSSGEYEILTAADCGNLAGKKGKVWITGPGTCRLASFGIADSPLLVIVESVDIELNANNTFWGRLFALGTPPSGARCEPGVTCNAGSIKANGGAVFNGSIISNDSTNMGININGTFDMIYRPLKGGDDDSSNNAYDTMVRTPGSWADFLK